MNSLQILGNKAAKLIVVAPPLSSATDALKLLNWTPLGIRRHKRCCIFIFKCINGLIDLDIKLTTNNNIHSHNIRTSKNLHLHQHQHKLGKTKTNLPSFKRLQ